MKISRLEYRCDVRGSKIELSLEDRLVAHYPISFTPRECLEEFCELMGWEFLDCGEYTFRCRIHSNGLIRDMIYNWADYYRIRVEEGTA